MTEIAIVGGGIGGLAAAAFLRLAGLGATVYEQASQLREVGAGVVVAPNAARLLRALGVLSAFEERAVPLATGWEFRRWRDGRVLSAEDLATECERRYGERTYTAHRADLLDAVRRAVPAGDIRLGRRCVGLDTGGPRPRLRFADGESAEADVVIGADGIHSMVRAALTEPAAPAYSGLCAFRALVPAGQAPSFARRPAQTLWLGPGHHLVHYPISAGRLVNLVAFAPAGGYTTESWTATATVA
ncbi:MAG TPA: FAD-dependent monooxygenase, partial [Trebonia sp.]|nr:FAD-dependent monooxygenase [Trebonia sp.]